MQKSKYWFFIEKELTDIVHELHQLLELKASDRDYEDTWEWFETDTKELNAEKKYVNIAREHNWEQGVYECPVMLLIKNSNIETRETGLYISNRLGVKVFYGKVVYDHGGYSYNKLLDGDSLSRFSWS